MKRKIWKMSILESRSMRMDNHDRKTLKKKKINSEKENLKKDNSEKEDLKKGQS